MRRSKLNAIFTQDEIRKHQDKLKYLCAYDIEDCYMAMLKCGEEFAKTHALAQGIINRRKGIVPRI